MTSFSFKNLLNDKLLVAGCTRFSGLTQGSVLDFFSSVTQNSCVMLSQDIKLEQGYINVRNAWASQTGFQWTKLILNCDTCSRPFIAEELWSWIFPPPENSVIINANKRYAESSNGKTWIVSDGDSNRGIVPFQSILLTEEFKKIAEIMHASWPFYH